MIRCIYCSCFELNTVWSCRVCMGICNSVFADDTDRFAEYLKRLLNATNPSDPVSWSRC